ncbi:cytidylyltransferase domain-containing protein [Neptuniibacter halophilus]|uniref:acylneuraminate cytidylyltransferase family protein n=1 Tax=Neptuniibacter halophilus TaxID=651666 RepID=UPI002572640F|nr:acylneuraminate cytidylyltransferase family protein [Neptuniibacter halophilus]
MNIAIIPARGGSKRLKRKNIRDIAGKPLMCWTIESAISSNIFDHIIVSTDCTSIQKVASAYDVICDHLRPEELATDESSTFDVVRYEINRLEARINSKIETVTILQPTSPLRSAEDICRAKKIYDLDNVDSVISVCEAEHPLEYYNYLPFDKSMKGFFCDDKGLRSQDFKIAYRLNGAIYMFKRDLAYSDTGIYTEGSKAYLMSHYDSVDIDTQFDFDFAECLLSKRSVSGI